DPGVGDAEDVAVLHHVGVALLSVDEERRAHASGAVAPAIPEESARVLRCAGVLQAHVDVGAAADAGDALDQGDAPPGAAGRGEDQPGHGSRSGWSRTRRSCPDRGRCAPPAAMRAEAETAASPPGWSPPCPGGG